MSSSHKGKYTRHLDKLALITAILLLMSSFSLSSQDDRRTRRDFSRNLEEAVSDTFAEI